jgi:hypothetical protein
MIKLLLLASVFIISNSVHSKENMKFHMQNIFTSYVELFKGDIPKSKKKKNLHNLEKYLLSSKVDKLIDSPVMTPIRKTIKESFLEIKLAHKKGEDNYVDYRVKNLISTCIACHSQLPSKFFKSVKARAAYKDLSFVDQFNMAKLLRDYQMASQLLLSEIQKDLSRVRYFRDIEKNLDILVGIHLTHLNDKDLLIKEIKKLSLNTSFSILISQYTENIQKQLKKWEGINLDNTNVFNLIKKYLKPIESELVDLQIVKNDYLVTTSTMKATLSQYILTSFDTKKLPEALYWRGLIESEYTSLDLYSLGELYHTECILRFPKSRFAKKCYQSLEKSIMYGFTGSSGTHIPQTTKKELKKLRDLIK